MSIKPTLTVYLLFITCFLLVVINILISIYLFIEGVKRSEKIYTNLSENRIIFTDGNKEIIDILNKSEFVICSSN